MSRITSLTTSTYAAHPLADATSLKILHVISGDLWAGAEVQAFTLLTALKSVPQVKVKVAVMNRGELANRLSAEAIDVAVLDERQLSSLQILLRLKQLIGTWSPDLVHTHRTKENVLGSVANRLSRNVPCIRTAHGANEHKHVGPRNAGKRLYRKLDVFVGNHFQRAVVAVSKDLALKLTADFSPQKIRVIDNGVNVQEVRAKVVGSDIRNQSPTAFHVGIVGRLVPVKRVDLFLEVAASLKSRTLSVPFRFHVIGDGPQRSELAEHAARLQLTDVVQFHGHRADVVACIAELDLLVMCSDHEGLPMTALESLAVGTPIVAHAVGGLVDLLENSQRSRLVTTHTAQDYAAAVLQVARERQPRADFSEVPSRFTSAANCHQMLALYRELVSSAHQNKP